VGRKCFIPRSVWESNIIIVIIILKKPVENAPACKTIALALLQNHRKKLKKRWKDVEELQRKREREAIGMLSSL